MKDFPAAHSMDSTWYAIDRDGHVAVFVTGESGCMPIEGYGDQIALHEEELLALPASGRQLDRAGYRAMHGDGHAEVSDGGITIIAFVRDLTKVGDLLPRLGATELPATSGVALVLSNPEADAFNEVHARNQCSGCWRTWRTYANEGDLSAHGIYVYDHTCDNWISGPYARMSVPVAPVHVDRLPHEIRDNATRFDGRWADVVELQPAEHWECDGWEAAWLAMDHKTVRPFADRQEEYDETVANLRGDIGDEMGLVFKGPEDD